MKYKKRQRGKPLRPEIYYLFLVFVISIICYYCITESYTSGRARKQTSGHIKQEIVQLLADILDTECKSIEIRAKVQQKICTCISQLAENDKNSALVNANRQDLIESLQKLKSIKDHNDAELKHLFEVLSFLSDGCISKGHVPQKQNQVKSISKPIN